MVICLEFRTHATLERRRFTICAGLNSQHMHLPSIVRYSQDGVLSGIGYGAVFQLVR